jgi:hypothetical protein
MKKTREDVHVRTSLKDDFRTNFQGVLVDVLSVSINGWLKLVQPSATNYINARCSIDTLSKFV